MTDTFRQRARNLREWVRHNITRRGRGALEAEEPDMPYLSYPPIANMANIASSPSRDPDPSTALQDVRASGSAVVSFFAKLPPETRRMILIAAFGGRTVHMHIRLSLPALPPTKQPSLTVTVPPGQRMPHGGLTAELNRFEWPKAVLEASEYARAAVQTDVGASERQWQWWGCVCHRNPPEYNLRNLNGLWSDVCLIGEAVRCDYYPGEAPGKCMIGCMGWLLACRQA